MSDASFEADWLELREPVDHRSRPAALAERLASWGAGRDAWTIVDLGAGTGSNLRYLSTRLPGFQRWTLVDLDAGLLARAAPPPGADVSIRRLRGDLGDRGLAALDGAALVTASALFDLASERWLGLFADACARSGCAVLVALTYDGSIGWSPADEDDELVRRSVNRHQRRDKGLGPALGPDAASVTGRALAARGYEVLTAPSDWSLGPGDAGLARPLLQGWAEAAVEEAPAERERIRAWAARRERTVVEGRFELRVGHRDVLALPPGGSR